MQTHERRTRKTNAGAIDIAVARDPTAFDALCPEWEALWGATPGSRVAQSPHWARHTFRKLSSERRCELCIVTGRIDGKLVAVLPMISFKSFNFTMVEALRPGASEFSDILVAVDIGGPSIFNAILDHLKTKERVGRLYLRFVTDESPILHALQGRRLVFEGPAFVRSLVQWTPGQSWDDYLAASTPKSMLSNYARLHRKLVRETGAVLAKAQGRETISAAVDWILRNKVDQFEKRNKNVNILANDRYQSFNRDICSDESPDNPMSVYTLAVGEKVIAGAIVAHGHKNTELLIITYDDDYAKYSPGRIVVEHIAREAFDRGDQVDLRVGEDKWKDAWRTATNGARDVTVHLNLGSLLAWRIRELNWSVQRTIRRLRGG